MLKFENFVFACPPLCGGSWFVSSALRLRLPFQGFDTHEPFSGSEKFRVGLVQNPKHWLEAFHSSALYIKALMPEVLNLFPNTDCYYQDFLKEYLDKTPGAVTNFFRRYAADVVLRVEDCPMAFLSFLNSLGMDVSDVKLPELFVPQFKYSYSHQDLLQLLSTEEELFTAFAYY